MCAACWFSYLLLLLEKNYGMPGTSAGLVMLAGQVADALATPVRAKPTVLLQLIAAHLKLVVRRLLA
jgi:hypothetical protein